MLKSKISSLQGRIGAPLLFAACLLGVACSDDDSETVVDTRASADTDFTAFETFAFVGANDMAPGDVVDVPSGVSTDLQIVNDAMREELLELGLREVSVDDDPDLRAFNLTATDDEEAVSWACVDGYWYGYWAWATDPCAYITPYYTEYTEGAILLGLLDSEEEEVVFTGLIRGIAEDADDFADRVDDDVDRVFDQYPANQTGR